MVPARRTESMEIAMALLLVRTDGWRVALQLGDSTFSAALLPGSMAEELRIEVFRNVSSTCDHGMLAGRMSSVLPSDAEVGRVRLNALAGEETVPSHFGGSLVEGLLHEYRVAVETELGALSDKIVQRETQRTIVTSAGFDPMYSSENTFILLTRLLVGALKFLAADRALDSNWVSSTLKEAMPT
jgi:hypothetical protein